MIRLSREIRFALASPSELAQQIEQPEQKNSWSAWPHCSRIAPQLRLQAVVTGEPDQQTGYLCNVKLIDDALRQFVCEQLIPSVADRPLSQLPDGVHVLRTAFEFLTKRSFGTATLQAISLHLSPFQSFLIETGKPSMIMLTQQFEFSAAHRLHCDSMSDEENLATFGKCNNPAGHGHNYVIEIAVEQELAGDVGFDSGALASIVNRHVIDVLDHKNLNEDISDFASLNPSVENICATIYRWLVAEIETMGCRLAEVKVFETPKTWASFRG